MIFNWARVDQLLVLGMVIQPLIGNPYNGYINPYYWVDDHPLLYGNIGSLDPSTIHSCSSSWQWTVPNPTWHPPRILQSTDALHFYRHHITGPWKHPHSQIGRYEENPMGNHGACSFLLIQSLKTNMTLENWKFTIWKIGNTSSNGCFSIVILVFLGV